MVEAKRKTDEILGRAISRRGEDEVYRALKLLAEEPEQSSTLTILGNGGMHPIPKECIHGELYTATHGTLDLSRSVSIAEAYVPILSALADKLRERSWKKVYFIPTGPTTLALQIKLLVYHITRISTIDYFYASGQYSEVNLDYRSYLSEYAPKARKIS